MKIENKTSVGVCVGSLVVIGIGVLSYANELRKEWAERRKINSNVEKDLKAVWSAYDRVRERLIEGRYDGPNMAQDALADFEFEQIVEFNKE